MNKSQVYFRSNIRKTGEDHIRISDGILRLGLSDVSELTVTNTYDNKNGEFSLSTGIKNQINSELRAGTNINYSIHRDTELYHSIGFDMNLKYIQDNSVSIDRMLSDEDDYFYHMLGKKQLTSDTSLTPPDLRIESNKISLPLYFRFVQSIGYGISDLVNILGEVTISRKKYSDIEFYARPNLKFINYRYSEPRKISREEYYFGYFLKPFEYKGKVYISLFYRKYSEEYINKFNRDTDYYSNLSGSLSFSIGILDNLECNLNIRSSPGYSIGSRFKLANNLLFNASISYMPVSENYLIVNVDFNALL